ncbi:MAG: aldehyde dehydrogenase family protein, partial [Bacillota bacterium]
MSSVKRLRYFVDGQWRDSKTDKYMPVTDSSTGEVMAEAPCCTAEEVDSAVRAAAAAFPEWSATPVTKRA